MTTSGVTMLSARAKGKPTFIIFHLDHPSLKFVSTPLEVWKIQRGATGRALQAGAEARCQALEDGSGKDGEQEASGAERAGNINHTAIQWHI